MFSVDSGSGQRAAICCGSIGRSAQGVGHDWERAADLSADRCQALAMIGNILQIYQPIGAGQAPSAGRDRERTADLSADRRQALAVISINAVPILAKERI